MNAFPLPDLAQCDLALKKCALPKKHLSPAVIRPLVLYGAGSMGSFVADLFQRIGVEIAYCIDRNPPENGLLNGYIPVIKPEQAFSKDRERYQVGVSIVNYPFEPIRNYLAMTGWKVISPAYDLLEIYSDQLPMRNGWFSDPLSSEDLKEIGNVLIRWDDDQSRAAHLQCLAWRTLREEWVFDDAPVTIDDRYFIPPVLSVLHQEERFLDAGAYRGDVIDRFLKFSHGKFQRILAVEADHENYLSLQKKIGRLDAGLQDRIAVSEVALGKAPGMKPFSYGFGQAARMINSGDRHVKVLTVEDLDFPLTFAKIHLEGGELDALTGGVSCLQRCRPIIAVTAYHNSDGLWRIPAFLMNSLIHYRFLMRLHAWCGTGCVVYAIPEERCQDK